VDLAAVRHVHGHEVAARVEVNLRHLVPDLLRWHLPRRPADGLLRHDMWFPLALFPGGPALVAHVPAGRDRPQRISQAEVFDALPDEFGWVAAGAPGEQHLPVVLVAEPDDEFVVQDPLLAAGPGQAIGSSARPAA
jgi:hypothetical protein